MVSRVYVGGIPPETRERDLEQFFKGFGRIKDVLIKNGYGFVEFEDYRDAEDAVYDLNGKRLLGMRVSVEVARGKPRGRDQEWFGSSREREPRRNNRGPPVRTPYRVFVENLSSSVSWQDLKDYLRSAGEVSFADAHKKYKNEGIVEFVSYDDMKRAIKKFDDTLLNGRRIRLVEDKSTARKRSYSKSASRSRSRSRSKSKSRSRSKDRRSRSRSGSKKSDKRSRSKSNNDRANNKSSPEPQKGANKRSRSRSASKSPVRRSAKRSRSGSRGAEKKSYSRSPSCANGRGRSRSR